MMKTYVTFGQIHIHSVNDKTFDHDCVAVIYCKDADHGRKLAFEFFGSKFSFEYHEDRFDKESMRYYHRGFIDVNSEAKED